MEKMNGYVAETYGGDKKKVMTNLLKPLSQDDMKALADHIAKF